MKRTLMAVRQGTDKRRTFIVLLAALVLLASCGSIVFRIVREQAWRAQAQREQIEQAHLYGPDGRDIRKPMRSLDEMYDYVGVRVKEEVSDSRYLQLPPQEKTEHNDALFTAMSDEIKRVTDSHFTKTFDRNAIEREYQNILWIDRMRSLAIVLAPTLLLAVLSGVAAVRMARRHSRQSADQAHQRHV